jgi:hypothetical protein
MVVSRCFEPPDLLVTKLTGVVTSRDQAELVQWIRASLSQWGVLRMLVLLERFAGRVPDASLDRPELWLRDDEGLSRMAIVGKSEWRIPMLTLLGQPLRKMPIEYFRSEDAARRWLRSNTRTGSRPAGT